jgi:hypothetical protein
MPVMVAVNREYAASETPLTRAMTGHLLPPVSGGGETGTRVDSDPGADRSRTDRR